MNCLCGCGCRLWSMVPARLLILPLFRVCFFCEMVLAGLWFGESARSTNRTPSTLMGCVSMEIPRALEPVPLIILEPATVRFQPQPPNASRCCNNGLPFPPNASRCCNNGLPFLGRPILRDTATVGGIILQFCILETRQRFVLTPCQTA